MMEGWTWKALCNEAPFKFEKNLASGWIRTHDPKLGALTARRYEKRIYGIQWILRSTGIPDKIFLS